MIIRINVNDNDYGERICEILDKEVNGLFGICDKYFNDKLEEIYDLDDEGSLIKYKDISTRRDNMRDWIFNGKIPDEEKDSAANMIKLSVLHLIKNSIDNDSLNYLKKVIEISFPETMDAKWENGEVIYYFPNTYSKNKFMLF